jgi:hypothetical protein
MRVIIIGSPFTDTKAVAARLLLTQSAQVSGVAAGKAAEAATGRGAVKALDRKVTRQAMFGAGVSDRTLPRQAPWLSRVVWPRAPHPLAAIRWPPVMVMLAGDVVPGVPDDGCLVQAATLACLRWAMRAR